jgi:predicted nuclease of predicted toxin-antitoxin system
MPAQFYLDENVSAVLAALLRALGHDVVTTAELGHKGASNVRLLSFAARSRRILISHDTGHFAMLHEAWQTWAEDWGVGASARHPGILLVPDSGVLPVAEAARVAHELVNATTSVENQLLVWTRAKGWREISPP